MNRTARTSKRTAKYVIKLRLFQFFWVWFGLGRVWVGFGSEFRKTFGYGLVLVFATIFQFGSALFQQNQKTIFQKFCNIFLKFFFSNFLKNMKIQYKNTFN